MAAAQPWLSRYPAECDWHALPAPETLVSVFDASVARRAAHSSMDFMGRRWTYAELGQLVSRAAAGLQRLGVGPGTRVGLCLPNSPYYVVAYFAALRLGAVVVNYNPLYVAGELAAQAADSGTEVMVAPDLDPILPRVLGLLGKGPVRQVVACSFAAALPMLKSLGFRLTQRKRIVRLPAGDARVTGWHALLGGGALATAPTVAPDDIAVLQYTGGTTGTPKAAVLTHANLTANMRQLQRWAPEAARGDERVLAVIPFFHVFALSAVLHFAIGSGAELIMLPRFEPAALLATLKRRRPTVFHGVPTLFKAVLDHGATKADLASITLCISGGAPLPLEIQRAFEAASGCRLVEGYGLTEASPVCFCNPIKGENRIGTIGLPLPGVTPSIRSLDDPTREVPPGEKGELCVRGPNVMRGYWNREAETANVLLADGFLRTGDVGTMDADGYVTLVDRIKDLIICSGFNVYPRTIEEALYAHPDVVAATVVGMPDAYRGESPAAFVEPRAGSPLTEAALRDFLKDRLSPIEMPKHIELRAELPRTAVGKLSKKELREEVRQQAAAAR